MSETGGAGRTSRLGGTVGGKLAGLLADASAATRAKTNPVTARAVNGVIEQWFRIIDQEARQAMGPVLQQVAQHPDLPAELRPLMRALAHPSGQWQSFIAQNVGGGAVSSGIIPLFDNLLAPVTSRLISLDPNSLLDAGTLAQASARGFWTLEQAADEARLVGIDTRRFNLLAGMARRSPDPGVTLEMLRRGIIDPGKATRYLRDAQVSDLSLPDWMALRKAILTPEQAAEMWNRNILSTEQGRAVARLSGVDPDDFDRLTELGGVPLAPQELGEAFRRGFIDQARFNRGIVQGPLRNEWFDILERLQFKRMSAQNAAQAVLQGKLPLSEGQRIAHENGLDPDDFATIVESTGQPPGISLMQEAWNRDLITEAEFEEGFLESNIKNRWIELLKQTRFRVLPREQINLTYRLGGFTRTQALQRYRWFGISPEDSAAMLATEDQRALGAERDLSVSTVRELYESRAITRNDAKAFYLSIGYTDDNAEFLLTLAEIRAQRRRDNLSISRVRSRFISFKVDEGAASAALDRIGVLTVERDDLIDQWKIEREVSIPRLTTSQIQQAFRKRLLSGEDAFTRLRENGYTDDDAAILLQIAAPSE